eukprot:4383419-Karenia_brevis.AAC.1
MDKSDGSIKYKSETDENVCKMFGLNMYEDVLYEFEDEPSTNPWSEMFCCDIMGLGDFDGMGYLVEEISRKYEEKTGGALLILLKDKESKRDVLKFDVKQYKQKN